MLSYILDYKKNKNKVLAFIILYLACFLELLLNVIYSYRCITVATLSIPNEIMNISCIFVVVGGALFSVFGITLIGLLAAWGLKLTKLKKNPIKTKNLLHLIISMYPIKCLISSVISTAFISYLSITNNLTFIDVYSVYNNTHILASALSIFIIILLIYHTYKKICK